MYFFFFLKKQEGDVICQQFKTLISFVNVSGKKKRYISFLYLLGIIEVLSLTHLLVLLPFSILPPVQGHSSLGSVTKSGLHTQNVAEQEFCKVVEK